MKFIYRAYTASGKADNGIIEAPDEMEASRQLIVNGKTPYLLRQATSAGKLKQPGSGLRTSFVLKARSGRFSPARLFLGLAVLTEAGMTVTQALRALVTSETSYAQKQAINTINTLISQGNSVTDSFAAVPGMSSEAVAMISSGERSAQLAATFRTLGNQILERDRNLSELRNALAYPAFLLAIMFLALAIVILVLVPALMPIFENSGQSPPWILRVLGFVGDHASHPLVIFTLFLLTAATASLVIRTVRSAATRFLLALVLRMPILGTAVHKIHVARYLGSLSLLLGGGTPMTEALTIAARSGMTYPFSIAIAAVRDRVSTGERLPSALAATGQFDTRIISLIAVGDEVNRLAPALSSGASILNEEAKLTFSRLVAAVTPLVTIVLGVLIGGLVVTVMSALLSINDLAVQ